MLSNMINESSISPSTCITFTRAKALLDRPTDLFKMNNFPLIVQETYYYKKTFKFKWHLKATIWSIVSIPLQINLLEHDAMCLKFG
jgi:hypothetical protein